MKKRLLAVLSCAAVISSAGISVEAAATENRENARIGISIYDFEDDYMTLYRTELVRYLTEELGFCEEDILVEDAENNQEIQTEQIRGFIDHQVDAMILNLVHPSSTPQITDICSESGIPVIYVNRQPYEAEMLRWEEEELQAVYVGADARQSGTYQGEEIAATETRGDINGDGTVSYVMIQGEPENIDTQYRSAYSVKALEDAGIKTKELLAENGSWNRDQGADIARKALEKFGKEIDVIFCNNDAMALGALTAVREAGREIGKDIYLTGVDALPEAVQGIEEGELTATVFNDYFSQSHTAAAAVAQYIQGGEPETVNMIDYIKVTKDNAESLLKRIS